MDGTSSVKFKGSMQGTGNGVTNIELFRGRSANLTSAFNGTETVFDDYVATLMSFPPSTLVKS